MLEHIEHVSVNVSDLARGVEFYEKTLAPLGYKRIPGNFGIAAGFNVMPGTGGETTGSGGFWIAEAGKLGKLTTHVAFGAKSEDAVKAFYEAALAAGGTDNGAPGPRPQYAKGYYAAFVLDPDGNNIEAKYLME